MSCSVVESYCCLGRICCLPLQGRKISSSVWTLEDNNYYRLNVTTSDLGCESCLRIHFLSDQSFKKGGNGLTAAELFLCGNQACGVLLGQVSDLVLEREGVPIITFCFSQLCCDKYRCFDTWMILAEEGMYSHFLCDVFIFIICISVHYNSWRILCTLIWHCMVWWKVTASLEKSTASIFRVEKYTESHPRRQQLS